MKVKINNVRLAFPNLYEPSAVGDGEPKFGCTFIIQPESANAKALSEAVLAVAKDKWADKQPGILKTLVQTDKVFFRKTPKTNASGDVYEGFEDAFWASAHNKARPIVLDADKTPLVQADGKPYGGCYVNLTIDVWAQDNKWGKRINATLLGVQFKADGEAFSGGVPGSADDFDDVSEGSDADDII